MAKTNGEMLSKYKDLGGLDDVDYPTNEFVFSWNRNSPVVRSETYKCTNCNHSFIGRERCDGRKCEKCGYPVKLYGYPDLVHDTFFDMDEVPYDFEENGYYNETQHSYENNHKEHPVIMDPEHIDKVEEQPLQANHIVPDYNSVTNDLPNNYSTVDDKSKSVEHMNGGDAVLCGFVVSRLLLFVVALLIANYRGELKKDDKVNWSLVGCVFFFPDIYFAYAIFEWLVRPKC